MAKLNITVGDLVNAINAQNTVNPAGQVGGPPTPSGQEFTYAITAQGRLVTEDEFKNIIVRENSDGSVVQLKDVARGGTGGANVQYRRQAERKADGGDGGFTSCRGRTLSTRRIWVKQFMAQVKAQFPPGLEYVVSLDTTQAVSQGIKEIAQTFCIALTLVVIVVLVFLQGWRASIIPLAAVPVSLIGTFAFFPLFGFSINTLSLLGLVLAIGLVVDDAIIVVEATERHIDEGLKPKEAAIKAMDEVAGPVVALALIMAAVFVPTIFIPGISGRLYQQFAVAIALSVGLSAFCALSLSPALAALLLKPKEHETQPGLLRRFLPGVQRKRFLTRHGSGICTSARRSSGGAGGRCWRWRSSRRWRFFLRCGCRGHSYRRRTRATRSSRRSFLTRRRWNGRTRWRRRSRRF